MTLEISADTGAHRDAAKRALSGLLYSAHAAGWSIDDLAAASGITPGALAGRIQRERGRRGGEAGGVEVPAPPPGPEAPKHLHQDGPTANYDEEG